MYLTAAVLNSAVLNSGVLTYVTQTLAVLREGYQTGTERLPPYEEIYGRVACPSCGEEHLNTGGEGGRGGGKREGGVKS
jgi:hypothetical protein